jgi:hypothetical protein
LEANATSKGKTVGLENLILELIKAHWLGTQAKGNPSKWKAYKCFNLRLNKIVESINVTIDETNGWKIKEENKDLVEHNHQEDLKEEKAKEEEKE